MSAAAEAAAAEDEGTRAVANLRYMEVGKAYAQVRLLCPWRLRRQEFGEACDREFCGQAVLPVFGGAEEVLKLKQKHSPKRPQQRTTKTSAKGGKRPLRFRSTRSSSLCGQGREGRSGRRRLHAQPLLRLREATKRAGPAEKVRRECQFSRFTNPTSVGV